MSLLGFLFFVFCFVLFYFLSLPLLIFPRRSGPGSLGSVKSWLLVLLYFYRVEFGARSEGLLVGARGVGKRIYLKGGIYFLLH